MKKDLFISLLLPFLLTLTSTVGYAQNEHEVEKGETLYSIAQRYEVSVNKLMEKNGIEEAGNIEPGQTLQLPEASPDTKDTVEHRVEQGETLYSICQQYQADIDSVLALNPEAKEGVEIEQILRIPVGTKTASKGSQKLPFDSTDPGYRYHRVEKKETLFSLSQEYNVSIERIRELNEHLEEVPKVGQMLRFPMEGEQKESERIRTEKVERKEKGTVRVKKGQTLYSIAQKHGVSVEDLKKANPDVKEGELETGKKLRIPGKGRVIDPKEKKKDTPFLPRSLSDTIIFHTVEKGESIRSIAAMYGTDPLLIILANELFFTDIEKGELLLIPIPEKKGTDPPPGSELKEEYRITLLLPLYPEANDTMLQEPFNKDQQLYGPSKYALEFYEGFRIAADSVATKGGSFEVRTISTRKDQEDLNALLEEKEVRESDLVIGPFYKKNLENTAEALKGSGTHIACPVKHSNKILLEGAFISKVIPSRITLLKQLGEHVAIAHGHQNLLMVKSEKENEERLERIFGENVNRWLSKRANCYRDSVKALDLDELKGALKEDTMNVLCVPGEGKSFATKLMNRVSSLNDDVNDADYPITIYAPEAWKDFETIDIDRKERFNLNIITGRHILHDSLPAQRFYRTYRERNHTDPSKYGFLGYDVGLFYLSALSRYGTSFPDRFEKVKVPTLHLDMDLFRTGVRSGYENRHAYIIRYTEDHCIERLPVLRQKEQ